MKIRRLRTSTCHNITVGKIYNAKVILGHYEFIDDKGIECRSDVSGRWFEEVKPTTSEEEYEQ